ncbi:aluminum-activated malate transporter 4-like [Bidens hawaiensis]|uniref:aluminum-activated malate transporter 4-like n=1 Tax=Bidens hawaiensis TaxID=980011 RepID=UPI00404B2452
MASKQRLLLSRKGKNIFESDYSVSDDASILDRLTKAWEDLQVFLIKVYENGLSDPRQFIFAGKSGLALAFVSILIFFKEPFSYIREHSIWAVLTVIVVFEFSIGATLVKGFLRGLGTASAAILALGCAQLSVWAGKWQECIVLISIFIAGAITSFLKLYPSMRVYEYGFRVFMLTFAVVMVSGTSEFFDTAVSRMLLVFVGAGICLIVSLCVYPIWSGEDLHKLVVDNFRGVATSLEGIIIIITIIVTYNFNERMNEYIFSCIECVRSYLQNVEYQRIPSKILVYQATDDPLYTGYRAAVQSTSKEEALLGFANWEPPHGPYKMWRYPWSHFLKVSGALRHCAFMVMAMHGCILSEIQAAPELRMMFRNEIQQVGIEGAKVLRELGNKLEKVEKLNPGFEMLDKVHEAAEDLQMLIDKKSYHLVKSEKWAASRRPKDFEDLDHLHEIKEEETPCLDEFSSHFKLPSHHAGLNQHMAKTMSINNASASCFGMNCEEQVQWPSRLSVLGDVVLNEREIRTYESATALSLTNFTSSLIEFVARLQNLLDSYKELSEKAKFSEPT